MSMNLLRRKAAESRPLTDEQLTIAWQTASLLLDYPDESLPERLALARRAYDALPDAVGGPLRATVAARKRRKENTGVVMVSRAGPCR